MHQATTIEIQGSVKATTAAVVGCGQDPVEFGITFIFPFFYGEEGFSVRLSYFYSNNAVCVCRPAESLSLLSPFMLYILCIQQYILSDVTVLYESLMVLPLPSWNMLPSFRSSALDSSCFSHSFKYLLNYFTFSLHYCPPYNLPSILLLLLPLIILYI